jgi:hypothetical protein
MSLREEFEPDFIDTFCEISEFATEKKLEISRAGQPFIFRTSCVWDTDTLRNRMIVQQQGVYLGEVLLFISKLWFEIEPKPDEVIWELTDKYKIPIRRGWRILECIDAEYVYEISLDRLAG